MNKLPLEEIKIVLKKHDHSYLPLEDAFFDKLHDQIMEQIEIVPMENNSMLRRFKLYFTKGLKDWSQVALSLTSMVLVSVVILLFNLGIDGFNDWFELLPKSSERAQEMTEQVELAPSLISYQNESDFFLDLAKNSIDDLSIEEFGKIVEKNTTR